ncbi:hypothetical protein [Enterococcus sp. DIV0660C]|uniref:hypothetical protein n=1 Tax=Enterococcus sp. DIV0660C TaxID=2230880 RepID=UPI001A90B10B|nr:hypothetical protein [Enterococcus sp. DIV0660C]MBO0432068.1 hypothetical protein [Enterococcus sp. DIV0660C]
MDNKRVLSTKEIQNITGGGLSNFGKCAAGTFGGMFTGMGTLGLAGSAIGPAGTVLGGTYGALGGALTGAAASC